MSTSKIVVLDPGTLSDIIDVSVRAAVAAETKEIRKAMQGIYAVKEWLTVKEAAAYLGIARKTMMDWKDQYDIPYQKRGQQLYFRRSDLDDFIAKAA